MDRSRGFLFALFAAVCTTTAGDVQAQGLRAEPQRHRAEKTVSAPELAAERTRLRDWLRQLEGRFDVQVSHQSGPPQPTCSLWSGNSVSSRCLAESTPPEREFPSYRGAGVCTAVGVGGGVSCRLDLGAIVQWVPTVFLLGLESRTPAIHLLQVGATTLQGRGTLRNDTATFQMECRSLPGCPGTQSLSAPAHGRYVEWTVPSSMVTSAGGKVPSTRPGAWVVTLTPAMESAVVAPRMTDRPPEDLREIQVTGQNRIGQEADILAWMRRLAGQFEYTGRFEMDGLEDTSGFLPLTGRGTCISVPEARAVQCEMRAATPVPDPTAGKPGSGAGSDLDPAAILFGIEPTRGAVRFLLVDSNGIAHAASGELHGDTLVSREPCVEMPQGCERRTSIRAPSGGDVVTMEISLESGEGRSRYRLEMQRIGDPE